MDALLFVVCRVSCVIFHAYVSFVMCFWLCVVCICTCCVCYVWCRTPKRSLCDKRVADAVSCKKRVVGAVSCNKRVVDAVGGGAVCVVYCVLCAMYAYIHV